MCFENNVLHVHDDSLIDSDAIYQSARQHS